MRYSHLKQPFSQKVLQDGTIEKTYEINHPKGMRVVYCQNKQIKYYHIEQANFHEPLIKESQYSLVPLIEGRKLYKGAKLQLVSSKKGKNNKLERNAQEPGHKKINRQQQKQNIKQSYKQILQVDQSSNRQQDCSSGSFVQDLFNCGLSSCAKSLDQFDNHYYPTQIRKIQSQLINIHHLQEIQNYKFKPSRKDLAALTYNQQASSKSALFVKRKNIFCSEMIYKKIRQSSQQLIAAIEIPLSIGQNCVLKQHEQQEYQISVLPSEEILR